MSGEQYTLQNMTIRHRCHEIVQAEPSPPLRGLSHGRDIDYDTYQVLGRIAMDKPRIPWIPDPFEAIWQVETLNRSEDGIMFVKNIRFCPYCAVELKKTLTVDFKLE